MLEGHKIVPVVVIKTLEDTVPTLRGLSEGGINIAEITFRTACAKDAIALGRNEFPNMVIGAGTILNVTQARQAVEAGALFIVSPGFDKETSDYLKEVDVPYIPGAVTPTEIMQILASGRNIVKFFPASNYGGLKTIKALSGPFKDVKFLPTGGIDETNIKEYLACENIIAIGGSFMLKGDIKENTRRVLELIKE